MNACTHSCDPSPDMEEVWKRSLIRVTDEFTLPPVVLRVDDAIIGTLCNFSVLTGKVKAKSPDQADGKCFRDFEMDLIVDSHNHAILTIVERSTNMLFMTKLAHGKKSELLAKAVRRLLPYKKYIKTITTDNCPEFVAHKLITKYLGAVFISQILMPHGRKERLKMQINSAGSIFPNKPTSMISQIQKLQAYRRKSIVDLDKS